MASHVRSSTSSGVDVPYHLSPASTQAFVQILVKSGIYLGPLLDRPSHGRMVWKPVSTPLSDTIEYSEAQELKTVPSSSRVSFKASGEIHVGDSVRPEIPLATLSARIQLCFLLFAHPSRYRPPDRKKANDYDLGIREYPVDEDRPMWGALFVEPWDAPEPVPVRLGGVTAQATLGIGFRGLRRTPDLLLQVAVGHGSQAPWPDLPGIVVRSYKVG